MGRALAQIALSSERPVQAVTGGETVVTFSQSQDMAGKGGRSQELALAFLLAMSDLQGNDQKGNHPQQAKARPQDWVLLAAGTDGRDGPTDAAGALVHSGMLGGMDVDLSQGHDALQRHDSYPFLDELGALIRMPPTGTNLADIAILLTA